VALNWITNAFMLVFGSSLLVAGALADRYGRRRVFLAGAAIFIAASLGLVHAPDIVAFDLLRAAQGLGGAAIFSGGAAALAQAFDGPGRMRAFSLLGASFGAGLSFGPIASALLIERYGWRSIFLLVIGLAAVALLLGARCLRESRDPAAGRLDWPGAATFSAALALLTWGIMRAPQSGWGDPSTLAMLAAAVALFAAFGVIELRAVRPMLDLTLFRYPRFLGVQLLAAAPAYAFVVLLILLPVRFIAVDGLGEIEAGRMMIALSAPLLLPIVAGQLTRWLAPALICGAGLLLAAAGLAWLSLAMTAGQVTALVGPMLLIGIGISLPWGLMDGLAVSVVPVERAGMATGIFSTTRVAGEGVALAVVSALLTGLTASHLATALPGAAPRATQAAQRLVAGDFDALAAILPGTGRAVLAHASADAFAVLLWILAAITVLTALVVFLFLGKPEAREAAPAAARA
ncbi:MFS transporter, partial [Achromobacter xylosoxidans]|uniref:MFS transporter n=1 Tax=Alcaligenes xylosoxydans xylosoxydans TaxID=85698 RepID=UPI001F12D347